MDPRALVTFEESAILALVQQLALSTLAKTTITRIIQNNGLELAYVTASSVYTRLPVNYKEVIPMPASTRSVLKLILEQTQSAANRCVQAKRAENLLERIRKQLTPWCAFQRALKKHRI